MKYIPGERVPLSAVYRVEHDSHRLMHEATLLVRTRFPRCKKCKDAVRFRLLRAVEDSRVLPLNGHALLEQYTEIEPPLAAAI